MWRISSKKKSICTVLWWEKFIKCGYLKRDCWLHGACCQPYIWTGEEKMPSICTLVSKNAPCTKKSRNLEPAKRIRKGTTMLLKMCRSNHSLNNESTELRTPSFVDKKLLHHGAQWCTRALRFRNRDFVQKYHVLDMYICTNIPKQFLFVCYSKPET